MAQDRLSPIIVDGVNRIRSTALASGLFGVVLTHEPKSMPPQQLSCCTWIAHIQPIALRSGLDVTSARVLMTIRIMRNMLAEPQDDIDTEVASAASYMLADLTNRFQLGETAWVDLEGAYGTALSAELGYIDIDKTIFRMVEIPVPIIAEDVYTQEAGL